MTRDWLTDDLPELRDAPPWVIFERSAGTNPDPIRREQRAHREAALIGDTTPGW